MVRGGRRWGRWLAASAIVAGLLWGCWRTWRVNRDRIALAAIRQYIRDGRHATAASKLKPILAADPGSDEALYLMGTCDLALGRSQAADAEWARVPPGSRFAARAILGRMQVELGRGRAAEAERLVREALADPRIDGSGLPILLGPILSQQGRIAEALQVIEARWSRLAETGQGASEPAIELVRLHIELRRRPIAAEQARAVLDQAGRLDPDDDRVWLGKANLAIREGAFDEAARWIAACLRRRLDDVPVWRARLDWAVASGRVDEARDALAHLPAAAEGPARVSRLAAWFASRRGDPDAERRALERLVAAEPGDPVALDRLAELSDRQGQAVRAAEVRRQRREIEGLRARYEALYQRNQPRRDADEMSRLAERLGRPFEARAFATIAAAADPDDAGLRRRLDAFDRPAPPTPATGGPTLADALAAEEPGPMSTPMASPRRPDRRAPRRAPG